MDRLKPKKLFDNIQPLATWKIWAGALWSWIINDTNNVWIVKFQPMIMVQGRKIKRVDFEDEFNIIDRAKEKGSNE